MSAPHNPARVGELWNETRLAMILHELEAVRDLAVISGGWAWHFMTPPAHTELKHAHDHKDVDVFVAPAHVSKLIDILKRRGYEKSWTRFGRLPDSQDFTRYTKIVEMKNEAVKIMLDVFIAEVPCVTVGEFRVVEPKFLLSLYGRKHGSDQCFAVRIASKLLAQGINPVGRPEMADYREFLQ
jgi:hypothetical protein